MKQTIRLTERRNGKGTIGHKEKYNIYKIYLIDNNIKKYKSNPD